MRKTYIGSKQKIVELGRGADIITSSGLPYSGFISFAGCYIHLETYNPDDNINNCPEYGCGGISACDWASQCYVQCSNYEWCP